MKTLPVLLAVGLSLPALATTRPCQGAPGAYRTNPDETVGGFVASSATVDALAWVGTEAQVCEFAALQGPVKIMDRALVTGRADLTGNVAITGSARVDGEATLINDEVSSDLLVMEDALIYGQAYLRGNIIVSGSSEVFGRAQLLDYVQIHGESRVCGNAILTEDLILTDDSSHCANKDQP